MTNFKKLILAGAAGAFIGIALLVTGSTSHADANCITVNADGSGTTPTTPLFNDICNAPYGVGNEQNFVRVRQSTNGNDEDNQNNPVYADTLSAACNSGDKFDVWTYIHNNASQEYNPDTNPSNPSAVAHNVQLALSAPLGATDSSFTFGGKVTADNAASVSDTAVLTCTGGQQVKLTLVPGTVHIYSPSYTGWKDLSDSTVNATTKLGSPTLGSGDQWGCWEYRMVVVYQVSVTPLPPTPVLECTLSSFNVEQEKRQVAVTVQANVQNATVTGYTINWGDNSSSSKQSDTHTYASNVTNATIQASFTATANGQSQTVAGANCMRMVSFKPGTPPVTPPQTPPTTLPNTGAGSMAGIFTGVTVAGAAGYRWFLGRRLNRQ